MPRPLPDPSPGTVARLREAAERLRSTPNPTLDDNTDAAADYESWTLARLRRRATELEVKGRSAMDKAELIATLRALGPKPDAAASRDQ